MAFDIMTHVTSKNTNEESYKYDVKGTNFIKIQSR